MKNTRLLFLLSVILLISCKKDKNPVIYSPPEELIQDSISIRYGNKTYKFGPALCPCNDTLTSSSISLYTTKDSFGITRGTYIYSADTIPCNIKTLGIRFDIMDKKENYPVTFELMKTYLDQIQQKTSTTCKLWVTFTDNCTSYQNIKINFNGHDHMYYFDVNKNFDYEIESYKIVDNRECQYYSTIGFLIELKGSFKGMLYTTPNAIHADSIFVECRDFRIRVYHDPYN